MEQKIIEGKFAPAQAAKIYCILAAAFLAMVAVLCIWGVITVWEDLDGALIGAGLVFGLLFLFLAIGVAKIAVEAENQKLQQLTVTNLRVYGKNQQARFEVTFDKISHVNLSASSSNTSVIAVVTKSGDSIVLKGCVNGEAVCGAINDILNKRNIPQPSSNEGTTKTSLSDNSKDNAISDVNPSEVMMKLKAYKELVNQQLITQEEYEAMKKQVLGL